MDVLASGLTGAGVGHPVCSTHLVRGVSLRAGAALTHIGHLGTTVTTGGASQTLVTHVCVCGGGGVAVCVGVCVNLLCEGVCV